METVGDTTLVSVAMCIFLGAGLNTARAMVGSIAADLAHRGWKAAGSPPITKLVKAIDKAVKIKTRSMSKSLADLYARAKLVTLVQSLQGSGSGVLPRGNMSAGFALRAILVSDGWMPESDKSAVADAISIGKDGSDALRRIWQVCGGIADSAFPFMLAAKEVLGGVCKEFNSHDAAHGGVMGEEELSVIVSGAFMQRPLTSLPSVRKSGQNEWRQSNRDKAVQSARRGHTTAAGHAHLLGISAETVSHAFSVIDRDTPAGTDMPPPLQSTCQLLYCSAVIVLLEDASAAAHGFTFGDTAIASAGESGSTAAKGGKSSRWRRVSGAASLRGEGKEEDSEEAQEDDVH